MATEPAGGAVGKLNGPELPAGARARLDELFRSDPFAASLGVELVGWEPGWAEVRLVPRRAHANFIGPVHGGVTFSLADVALSYAGNSWGRVSVALSMEVQFLRAGEAGAPLRAVARCRHRSRRISAFSVDVDVGGELVATFQALNYRTDRWHFGEDAWPEAWRARY